MVSARSCKASRQTKRSGCWTVELGAREVGGGTIKSSARVTPSNEDCSIVQECCCLPKPLCIQAPSQTEGPSGRVVQFGTRQSISAAQDCENAPSNKNHSIAKERSRLTISPGIQTPGETQGSSGRGVPVGTSLTSRWVDACHAAHS